MFANCFLEAAFSLSPLPIVFHTDGASWHRYPKLKIPQNITLISEGQIRNVQIDRKIGTEEDEA
jgi:hypothetical protein